MSSWMTVNDHLLLLDSWVSLLFHFSSLSPTWHVFARCDFRPEAAAQTQWSRTAAVCLDYSWQQTNDCHCPTLPELCACRMKKTCATGNSVVLAVQSTMNRKVRVLQAGNIAELLRVWRQRERKKGVALRDWLPVKFSQCEFVRRPVHNTYLPFLWVPRYPQYTPHALFRLFSFLSNNKSKAHSPFDFSSLELLIFCLLYIFAFQPTSDHPLPSFPFCLCLELYQCISQFAFTMEFRLSFLL